LGYKLFGSRLDLSGSRDVIGHVTIRLAKKTSTYCTVHENELDPHSIAVTK